MPEYIDVPFEEDPDELANQALEHLEAEIVGWTPHDGNLEVLIIEAFSRIAAITRTLASAVPTSIFRVLGAKLFNLPPVDAAPSSMLTTWNVVNNVGYVIPAGTEAGVRSSGGELVVFATTADAVVTAGTTQKTNVLMVSVETGEHTAGHGIAGTDMELVDQLSYVTLIELQGTTTGGADAEPDALYLDRLATELQLMTPRPILPGDFSVLARRIPGVYRATTVDGYNTQANEIQTVDVDATGGTLTLTFQGQTTAAIAWNATAAAVQLALEALSNIAPGDVFVTGGPSPAILTFEFMGAFDGVNVTEMTSNAASLTGGAASVTHATVRQGIGVSAFNTERMVTVFSMDSAGNPVSGGIKTQIQNYLESLRELNFVVNTSDATLTAIDANFTVTIQPGFVPAEVVQNAEDALTSYLSPKNWGLPQFGTALDWTNKVWVRYLEIAQVVNNTPGVDEITALTLRKGAASFASADVQLLGVVALPTPGTMTGTPA